MFLVESQLAGSLHLVFTDIDPRRDGYNGDVLDVESFDYPEGAYAWPSGPLAYDECVGRDPQNTKHYKLFRHERERTEAGYVPVAGTPCVLESWSQFVN